MYFRLLLSMLLVSLGANAQVQKFTLNGSLGVQGGESFKYKMVFTDSFGYINGYALTYEQENKDTKALISGGIDRVNRTLSFRETRIVYNNGFHSNATICLIEATLEYKKDNGSNVLTGSINSSDISHSACSRGSLLFLNREELDRIFDPVAQAAPSMTTPAVASKPAPKPKAFRVIYDTAAPPPPVRSNVVKAPDEITDGSDQWYEWATDTVVLEVWDGGQIDNDNISILFNGQPVLSKYVLSKEKKRLLIPVSGKAADLITIVANNEGNDPPNTANLMLTDGTVQHPVVAYNSIGRKATIRIRRATGSR